MRKVLFLLVPLMLSSAAVANTRSDHDHTRDNFFRCGVNQGLWHAIATGNWPFWCW